MFRSPLCSPWLTPLADFLFVSLRFSLPPSLSVSLPPTIHRITWARGMKRCIVFFWMRAACVCVRVAAILYRYADIAALACYSGQRRKGCVLSTIYRPFPHVISPVLLAAHTEAPFQQTHLYTSYFIHWIMWRVEVSPVKLQRTLWLLYRFCIRVQVGRLRPLKLPFRQQCRFFLLLCTLEMEQSDYFTVTMKTHQSLIIKKRVRITSKNKRFEKVRFIFHSCFLF